MKNKKCLKILSTVLIAFLIISIAPMNDSVVGEMKSSANSVIKNIGEAVENIDFTLPKIDVKAEAAERYSVSDAINSLTTPKQPYTYEIKRKKSTSTLTITCSGEMPSYYGDAAPWSIYKSYENLVIKGDVENIGAYAFVDFTNLKKVTIDASVKTIGYQAFYGCTALTTVNLPDSLKSIYNQVFEGCSSLKKITIPENVIYIGNSVFRGCPLKTLTIPFAGSGSDKYNEAVSNQLGFIFGTTEYDDTYPVKSVTNADVKYYIPHSLKTVKITKTLEKYNFQNCIGIEKIIIEDTVKSTAYSKYFAYGCTGLKTVVTNTNKITGVGADAFRKCTSLTEFVLPDRLEWIGEYAFYSCTSLASVYFPEKDFFVRRKAFDNTPFWDGKTEEFVIIGDGILVKYNGTATNVVIPEGVKRVGCAFDNRSDILSIEFPDSLKYVSPDSFYGCLGITELVIPDSVIEIGEQAFDGMCNLESLTVPFIGESRNVTTGTQHALIAFWFKDGYKCGICNNEECIRRSQSYQTKYTRTFYQPKNLKSLTITSGVVRSKCLTGIYMPEVTIGANVTGIEKYGLYKARISNIYIDPLCNIEALPDYALAENRIQQITLPTGIKKLGAAFVENPLASIALHEGIEEINGTFRDTKISSIELPSTLKKILGNAFENCADISKISIGKSIEEISDTAFIGTKIQGFYVDEENQNYFDEAGVLYDKNGVLVAYPLGNTADTYYISDRVTLIPHHLFYQFKYIAKIVADENNPLYTSIDGVLYNKDVTEIIWYPQKKVGDYTAFDTIEKVGENAFYKVDMGKLEFPKDVEFKQNCFYQAGIKELVAVNFTKALPDLWGMYHCNLENLTKLVLTNQTSDIPERFVANFILKEIEINGNFTHVGDFAFYLVTGCDEIILPDTVECLGKAAFRGSFFKRFYLGDSLKRIEDECFYHLLYCEGIELPETVEYIGHSAFAHSDIKWINLGANITYIGGGAFYCCPLKKVVISENLLGMADKIFYKCEYLETIIIGGSVKEIESKSFAECPSLQTVVIPDGVEEISDDAFENSTDNLTIYCNEESYAESYAKENNIQYTTLVLDSIENQIYTGEEIKPYVGASANGKRLSLDTEYTVDYKNNINAGSAKIIARGLGDFKALIAVGKFTILPKEMENIEIISQEAEFDPLAIDFKVDVFLDEIQLIKNVDYELVTETKVCDVGENNIAVCGIGNYSGIENITVNVLPRDIAKATIKTGKKVVVTDKGKELIKDVDYIETRTKDENGKEITEIKGIGNYDGAVICSENERISISFFDVLIEFIQSLIKMLMM